LWGFGCTEEFCGCGEGIFGGDEEIGEGDKDGASEYKGVGVRDGMERFAPLYNTFINMIDNFYHTITIFSTQTDDRRKDWVVLLGKSSEIASQIFVEIGSTEIY